MLFALKITPNPCIEKKKKKKKSIYYSRSHRSSQPWPSLANLKCHMKKLPVLRLHSPISSKWFQQRIAAHRVIAALQVKVEPRRSLSRCDSSPFDLEPCSRSSRCRGHDWRSKGVCGSKAPRYCCSACFLCSRLFLIPLAICLSFFVVAATEGRRGGGSSEELKETLKKSPEKRKQEKERKVKRWSLVVELYL